MTGSRSTAVGLPLTMRYRTRFTSPNSFAFAGRRACSAAGPRRSSARKRISWAAPQQSDAAIETNRKSFVTDSNYLRNHRKQQPARGDAMSSTNIRIVFLLGFLLIGVASSGYGQISQSALEGTVKDNSGASIPGATVTLRNKGTTATRTALSDASGQYSFPNLDPAEYTLSAGFRGFRTLVIGSVTLHTGERSSVDLTLELGDTTQEVTVDAAVPLLATTSTEVSHLVPPAQVAELPLNGRNFWELTQLTPGATFIPRGQLSQYNGSEIRPRNVNVTVNGQGYIFTGWSLDGANVTNFELGGTLIVPNVDAIQEFTVLSGNMPPEFGHTPNMVVASLKSGTNRFHGTVFEFLRNDKFDARNFFLAKREPLKRNQLGATIGGPVKKDRVFFFADFQATRLQQGTTFNYVVPSVSERSGDFSDILPRTVLDPLTRLPFPDNVIPANRLSSQGKWFVPFIPIPNVLQGTCS